MKNKTGPQRVKDMLAIYYDKNNNSKLDEGDFLTFDEEGDLESIASKFDDPRLAKAHVTIYNPTKPILHEGKLYLFGRVEPRQNQESKVMIFEQRDDIWRIVDEAPVLGLEDPFHIPNIQGWKIVGGVETFDHDDLRYRTIFYRYKDNITELFADDTIAPPFAKSPLGMKDIRLIELKNGNIAVFTRPQGGHAGPGKIAYIEINRLEDLEEAIPKARVIENQFHFDEWGGANDLHLLKNGLIGVLGHIAHYDGNVRHYYAMAFVFNPKTRKHSHMEILTTADDFPPVEPKKGELGKVIFSGGLHRNPDGTADLYVGVGDVKAGKIKIKDPFIKYEKNA